jgi:hypothetical protein
MEWPKMRRHKQALVAALLASMPMVCAQVVFAESVPAGSSIGYEIRTVPVEAGIAVRGATFAASGKILISFARGGSQDWRQVNLRHHGRGRAQHASVPLAGDPSAAKG